MTPAARVPALTAEGLSREARRRGLLVLGTSEHQANPEVLKVWLHGNAAQWVDGVAQRVIGSIPGVLAVTESVQLRELLFVRVALGLSERALAGFAAWGADIKLGR